MNILHPKIRERANRAAIYTLYLILSGNADPADQQTLRSLTTELEAAVSAAWTDRERYRLHILRQAIDQQPTPANARLGNLTRSENGLTACTFTEPDGEVFVVFKGTGSGEWIDNGEGLSGIPEENTYLSFDRTGTVIAADTLPVDYATDQQVEALNWFRQIAAENGWTDRDRITTTGHSKGGNKAQFVAIHEPLIGACYSFDGQGFSPEALAAFRNRYGAEFEARRQNIRSFAADNDYVNVLGDRLMPPEHVYYFESAHGFHYMEAMLDIDGRLRPQTEQGPLSRYVESVSRKLMQLPPAIRKYATLGVMNIFQQYLGKGVPVNGDAVSAETTVAGLAVAIGALLRTLGI